MSDLLVVGHVSRDEFPGSEWRLGGSALYAAVTAARLGRRTTLVTRIAPAERPALERCCGDLGIQLEVTDSAATTTFAIAYDDAGRRHLTLRARADDLTLADVPPSARTAAAVVLASIARELGADLPGALGGEATVLVAQGFLRGWSAAGLIGSREWPEAELVLREVGAVVVSEDDLGGDLRPAQRWSHVAPVVVTVAERGARLWQEGRVRDIAGFPAARIVDPTGAGDAFAAGLAIARADGRSLPEAVRYANGVASFAVEGIGTAGLADRERVAQRIAAG